MATACSRASSRSPRSARRCAPPPDAGKRGWPRRARHIGQAPVRGVQTRAKGRLRARRASVLIEFRPMPSHDVLIIGAGLAGQRAALAAAETGSSVAIMSKVHPVR
ncbi:MAG: FAD-binding protein, partial [Solirubrobacteraceae bacterium]